MDGFYSFQEISSFSNCLIYFSLLCNRSLIINLIVYSLVSFYHFYFYFSVLVQFISSKECVSYTMTQKSVQQHIHVARKFKENKVIFWGKKISNKLQENIFPKSSFSCPMLRFGCVRCYQGCTRSGLIWFDRTIRPDQKFRSGLLFFSFYVFFELRI